MDDNEWRAREKEKIASEMESIFQSKRDKIKKQLTHFIGKFMIVKAENNRLRSKVRMAFVAAERLVREKEGLRRSLILQKQISGNTIMELSEQVRSLKTELEHAKVGV